MTSKNDVINYIAEHETLKGYSHSCLELSFSDVREIGNIITREFEYIPNIKKEYNEWKKPIDDIQFKSELKRFGIDYYSNSQTERETIIIIEQMRILADKLRNKKISENVIKLGLFPYVIPEIDLLCDYNLYFCPIYSENWPKEDSELYKKAKIEQYKRDGWNEIINFDPLERAVYNLCLSHPEGVDSANFENYVEEFTLLYSYIIINSKNPVTRDEIIAKGENFFPDIHKFTPEKGKPLNRVLKKGIDKSIIDKINYKIQYIFSDGANEYLVYLYLIHEENGKFIIRLDRHYCNGADKAIEIVKKRIDKKMAFFINENCKEGERLYNTAHGIETKYDDNGNQPGPLDQYLKTCEN